MAMRSGFLASLLLALCAVAKGQTSDSWLTLRVDTQLVRYPAEAIAYQGQNNLAFQYEQAEQEALLWLTGPAAVKRQLIPGVDYRIIDSLRLSEDSLEYRIKFTGLDRSGFPRLSFHRESGPDKTPVVVSLLPYRSTQARLETRGQNLYVGEEKQIEVLTNDALNLDLPALWQEAQDHQYRFSQNGGRVLLHVLPKASGTLNFQHQPHLKAPVFHEDSLSFYLPPFKAQFPVKRGRMAFLNVARNEVIYDPQRTQEIEVQIDDHWQLALNKTYRIEAQEEPGGPLVAELFTKSKLNNDRVLALLRPYDFHRKSEGYLYLKEGDESQFITNINISHKTQIDKIFLQRKGQEWQAGTTVYPGEILNVKLVGQGLHRGEFNFYGAPLLTGDSLVRNEEEAYFRIEVPLDIANRKIEIFNNNKKLNMALQVKEYQKPRPFDFIDIRLGLKRYTVSEVTQPLYYESTLSDVVIDFKPKKIDRPDDLHGTQYLTIKVKISNKKGNLIELYQFDQVTVCPGENSPRFKYYDQEKCQILDFNLNNFITRKTHSLEEWSRIELEFSHQEDQYDKKGYQKRVQILLKRRFNYDIEVSFPAGLLILKQGVNDFSNFGGISFAMIAQMSFYHPEKIAKYRPYKIGAGFIALDAFNFSENSANRDVGLVVLGSLYPTSSENKLSFPLYAGIGYLLREQRTFFLIGPGIRVRF